MRVGIDMSTSSFGCRLVVRLAAVDDAPDAPRLVVRDVQAAVRSFGDARGSIACLVAIEQRRLAGEAVGEGLVFATPRPVVLELDEDDAETSLRQRGAVPRAVEDDEGAAAIPLGKLVATVEQEIIRSPVAWKADEGQWILVAAADDRAVATLLGRQNTLALLPVVVTVGPAEV